MRIITRSAIIGIIFSGIIVVSLAPWASAASASTTTLNVQAYGFSTSPQGIISVAQLYYILDGQHELVVKMASVSPKTTLTWITSDARNWTTPGGVAITQRWTWVEIPGWNCGYSDDNGRMETTQIATSTGAVMNLSYPCIYPPTASSVTFHKLLTAPWSDGHGTTVP